MLGKVSILQWGPSFFIRLSSNLRKTTRYPAEARLIESFGHTDSTFAGHLGWISSRQLTGLYWISKYRLLAFQVVLLPNSDVKQIDVIYDVHVIHKGYLWRNRELICDVTRRLISHHFPCMLHNIRRRRRRGWCSRWWWRWQMSWERDFLKIERKPR